MTGITMPFISIKHLKRNNKNKILNRTKNRTDMTMYQITIWISNVFFFSFCFHFYFGHNTCHFHCGKPVNIPKWRKPLTKKKISLVYLQTLNKKLLKRFFFSSLCFCFMLKKTNKLVNFPLDTILHNFRIRRNANKNKNQLHTQSSLVRECVFFCCRLL